MTLSRITRANAAQHAISIGERGELVRTFLRDHPNASRQAILDAMPGKRANSGEALRRLLIRGSVVKVTGEVENMYRLVREGHGSRSST
ncbi:MAG TPA: hypothetical protein VN706_18760 [Gemmatimonadaceae bacterium]|nr:hypothetical protein [Gemmatimonadaceae bacterium]